MIKADKSVDLVSPARTFNRQVRQSILREESVQTVLQFFCYVNLAEQPNLCSKRRQHGNLNLAT